MPENPAAIKMNYIGLLTNEQKRAGYFVSQDEDFVWVWRSKPYVDCIAIFLYNDAKVKEIRDVTQQDLDRMGKES